MVTANGDGLAGRDHGRAPAALAECLRRVVASQEMTVEAAISGNRDTAVDAMLLDPLAGRIDFDHVAQMTDEMLAATARGSRSSRDAGEPSFTVERARGARLRRRAATWRSAAAADGARRDPRTRSPRAARRT